jgi:hypothetical protein
MKKIDINSSNTCKLWNMKWCSTPLHNFLFFTFEGQFCCINDSIRSTFCYVVVIISFVYNIWVCLFYCYNFYFIFEKYCYNFCEVMLFEHPKINKYLFKNTLFMNNDRTTRKTIRKSNKKLNNIWSLSLSL